MQSRSSSRFGPATVAAGLAFSAYTERLRRRGVEVLAPPSDDRAAEAEVAEAAAKELGLAYELEKVTPNARFADFGVMSTPALVVDGVVKVAGHVPIVAEAYQLLA